MFKSYSRKPAKTGDCHAPGEEVKPTFNQGGLKQCIWVNEVLWKEVQLGLYTLPQVQRAKQVQKQKNKHQG